MYSYSFIHVTILAVAMVLLLTLSNTGGHAFKFDDAFNRQTPCYKTVTSCEGEGRRSCYVRYIIPMHILMYTFLNKVKVDI